ncbi:histidine kinase [Streptomyces sp. NBC_00667]|nr:MULTISPECIES: histidine kinase [unclassified Streptomyces]WUC68699.1 histidine kinase [Streptomyces sp. NBC_00539]
MMTGWWRSRGTAGKVELYTRWSFHSFVVLEIASFGLGALASATGDGPERSPWAVALALFLLVCVQSVLVGALSSQALDWLTERRDRPVRLAVFTAAFTGAACLTTLVLVRTGQVDAAVAPPPVLGMTGFACGSFALCVRRVRHVTYGPVAAAAFTGAAVLALGLPAGDALGYVIGVLGAGFFLCVTCRFSAWLLQTVHELDRSREYQARLAVAEERLRFGRDLHDVMGRNLAVIALKSELAVQLARRERPEAVEQMIEVQRIARESQREVRDVVRGYREADLAVELEGARGVLSAAGMDCRVEFESGRALPPEVQSALGWVVREATTNVLRHGDARSCLIRLTAGEGPDGPLTLLVENDGAPAAAPSGPPGSGLAGLRERLAVVDGSLRAGPVEGGRFRLVAQVPGPRTRTAEVGA